MMNIQFFGQAFPPWYGEIDLVDKISGIDEKINELFIVREKYVEDLKKAIEKKNNSK